MASDPVMAPGTDGVKVTFTLQDPPAFNDEPQVFPLIAKFPVAAIELMLTAAALVFLNLTDFAALVVLTICG